MPKLSVLKAHEHTWSQTCILCAIKHVGAAKVKLAEALASSDPERRKRRLLEATFELNEAETAHLQEYPELAQKVRALRKKLEEYALGFTEKLEVGQEELNALLDELIKQKEVCPTCVVEMALQELNLSALEGRSFADATVQEEVKRVLEMLAKEYGVRMPTRIVFKENSAYCENTHCTIITDKVSEIWYNPNKGFSWRSVFHEWYHHMTSVLGRERARQVIKERLGIDVSGDPDSEVDADIFARAQMEKLRLNSSALREESVKVLKQEGFSARLDDLYAWLEPILKVDRETLNEAYSPELFGSAIEVVYDNFLTGLGATLANLVTWLGLQWGATLGRVPRRDRDFLTEWAAHHFWRLLQLAKPGYLRQVVAEARLFGNALATGGNALHQVILPPEDVATRFKTLVDTIQGLLKPLVGGKQQEIIVVPGEATPISSQELQAMEAIAQGYTNFS